MSSALRAPLERALSEATPLGALQLYLEICDIVNETEDGHIEAMKIIRRKITSRLPPQILLRILAVLEVFVNNCHRRFRALVAAPDFVAILTSLVDQPGQSTIVRNQLLLLLQAWAEMFVEAPELAALPAAVAAMRQRGVEFPAPGTVVDVSSFANTAPPRQPAQDVPTRIVELQPNQRIHADAAQLAKLHRDLAAARAHAARLETRRSDEGLRAVCTVMRDRAVTLTMHIANEDLLADILVVIDALNAALSPASTLAPLVAQQPHTLSAAPHASSHVQPQLPAHARPAEVGLSAAPFGSSLHAPIRSEPPAQAADPFASFVSPAAPMYPPSGFVQSTYSQPASGAPWSTSQPAFASSQAVLVQLDGDLHGSSSTDDVPSHPAMAAAPAAHLLPSNPFAGPPPGAAPMASVPSPAEAPAYAPPPALRRTAATVAPAATAPSRDKMEAEHDELFAL